ncbi:Rho GTPase-activating protein 39, partial [Fragariocoptes setiger]
IDMDDNSEWVEIIEPKTKERVFANLESGICSRLPPIGAKVRRSRDFVDHWWQLLDNKSGKYYYYNVDRQETVWTRPRSDPKILIIPVAKLQSCAFVSPEKKTSNIDASTQTSISPNLVTIGTQTAPIHTTDTNNSHGDVQSNSDIKAKRSSNSSYSFTSRAVEFLGKYGRSETICFEPRQSKERNAKSAVIDASWMKRHQRITSPIFSSNEPQVSAQHRTTKTNQRISFNNDTTINRTNPKADNPNNAKLSTKSNRSDQEQVKGPSSSLTNYLVGEARAMGIALVSDDEECNDDEFASEDDYALDDDDLEDEAISQYEDVVNSDERCDESWQSSTSSHDDGENQLNKKSCSNLKNDTKERNPHRKDDEKDRLPKVGFSGRVAQLKAKFNSTSLDKSSSQTCSSQSSNRSLDNDPIKSEDQGQVKKKGSPYLRNRSGRCSASEKFSGSDLRLNPLEDSNTNLSESPTKTGLNYENSHLDLSSKQSDVSSDFTSDFGSLSINENSDTGSQPPLHPKVFKKESPSIPARPTKKETSEKVSNEKGKRFNVAQSFKDQCLDQSIDEHSLPFYTECPSEQQLRQVSALSTLPRQKKQNHNNRNRNRSHDNDHIKEGCESPSGKSIKNQMNSMQTLEGSSSLSSTGLLSEFSRSKSSRGSNFSVESFARENLRHQRAGPIFFKRKVKWSRKMITWTPCPIKQPMITSLATNLHDDAVTSFKLILQFMGDRKVPMTKKFRQIIAQERSDDRKHNDDRMKLSVGIRDQLALDLITMGCTKLPLRDEIYVQLARQVTQNPQAHSTEWGLILMAILLSYFSPSSKFSPFLLTFLENFEDHSIGRDVCLRRLDKRIQSNWTTYCRRPANIKEISMVRMSITRWPNHCGVFGEHIERLMRLQATSPFLKTLQLPWILTILTEKLLECGGAKIEGIFRCAADCDLIAQLKLEIDCLDFRRITDSAQVRSLFSNVVDPHVIATLLKLFFRELPNSIFSCQLYDTCLKAAQEGAVVCCRIVMDQLPPINKLIIGYLIRFLQVLASEENVANTKMDTSNLSMVWAPNLLRSDSVTSLTTINADPNSVQAHINGAIKQIAVSTSNTHLDNSARHDNLSQSQNIVFEKTRQEMQFLRLLIENLDTSFVTGIV